MDFSRIAFQRRERGATGQSPVGTAELGNDFARPFGTCCLFTPNPALKRRIVKCPYGTLCSVGFPKYFRPPSSTNLAQLGDAGRCEPTRRRRSNFFNCFSESCDRSLRRRPRRGSGVLQRRSSALKWSTSSPLK